ncbi:MAG: hypothetical protein ABH862_02755, partial [Candidatus Omnitrophota bacterium]
KEKALLIAGGHGIAPLYALAEQLLKEKKEVIFFIGACEKKHVIFRKEVETLGIKVNVSTEDGACGHKGYVTEPLEIYLKKVTDHPRLPSFGTYGRGRQSPTTGRGSRVTGHPPRGAGGSRITIYACGPKPMLKEVARIAGKYKTSAQVSLDEYMACGIGVCQGCAIKTKSGYKLVCKDGPVFDAGEIVWGEERR